MIIADTLRSISKAFAPDDVPQQPASNVTWLLPQERDPARKIGDGGAASITGAVLNWYFRNFPEAELRVSREDKQGQRTPVVPHPLSDLIDTPNDYYDGDALWMGMIFSYILDGNGYWLAARNPGAKRIVELWWVPHTLIEPKGSDDAFIDHYLYRVAGKEWKIEPSEIAHVRFGVDPKNPRKGVSPLKQQLRELLTDEEAARFSAAMVQNVGVPGLVVSPVSETAEISEPDALKTKAKFEQEFGGDNRGRTIVQSGATRVEQLGFSPEQLTLRDLRAIPEERVSAALGVPAAVVGLGTGLAQTKVGATMHELREMATEQALVPMWRTFARQVERALLHEFSGGDKTLKLSFDTSEVRVLQEDRQRLHERTRDDVQAGLVDVATAQGRLGYPVDERQRVYLRPVMIQEVPAAPPPTRGRRSLLPAKGNGKLTDIQRASLAFVRYVDAGMLPLADAFERKLTDAFEQLGILAADAYLEARKGRKQDPADAELVDQIVAAMRIEDFKEATFRPLYVGTYEATARLAIEAAGQALGIDLEKQVTLTIGAQDTIAQQAVAEGGTQLGLLDLDQQTADAIFRVLAQARELNLSNAETARLIRDFIPAGPYGAAGVRYRAETIARTELMHARNFSTLEMGEAMGFENYIAFDNRTGHGDDECMARDGQEFTFDEAIAVAEHPRGTLSFSPVPRTLAE